MVLDDFYVSVSDGQAQAASASASRAWSCKHCTFENTEPRADCAVCGLPSD